MKIRSFEDFPSQEGIYFAVNRMGYLALCKFKNRGWYTVKSDTDDLIEEKDYFKFAWVEKENNA